jgi:hypothetical protein
MVCARRTASSTPVVTSYEGCKYLLHEIYQQSSSSSQLKWRGFLWALPRAWEMSMGGYFVNFQSVRPTPCLEAQVIHALGWSLPRQRCG